MYLNRTLLIFMRLYISLQSGISGQFKAENMDWMLFRKSLVSINHLHKQPKNKHIVLKIP